METDTEAVVALQPVEIEIRAARGDFPGVVEDRRIHEAVGHDAPLRLKRQTVLVAEAVAGESAQRRSASHIRQHEEGHLLIGLAVGGPRDGAQRDDPGFAQDRNVLDRFVVDLPETEPLVLVGVIVQRDAIEAAAPGIPWRRSPVEPDSALRMEIRGLGAKARQGCRRVHGLDRWEISLAGPQRPLGQFQTSAQHQQAPCRPERQRGRPVRLSKIEVRAIVLRRAHPDAIEGRLCRLAPAAEERQRAAAMEQTRGGELRFDALVAQDRIAAAHIEQVVRAHVMRVPDAEREASAIVRTLEERVPARHAVDQDVLGSVEQRFDLARDVRVQGFDFLCLRLLDGRLTRRGLRLLRDDRRRGSSRQATTTMNTIHNSRLRTVHQPRRGVDAKDGPCSAPYEHGTV